LARILFYKQIENQFNLNFKIMDFKNLYENAKNKATNFMISGQISNYIIALKKMNQYKKMMTVVVAN